MKKFFAAALDNIAKYGDTDIFPFPIENYVLNDKKGEVLQLLLEAYSHFDDKFHEQPPSHIRVLAPVGLTGFRWATQLDPFWNAFLLGITLSIGQEIEAARISADRGVVYSYRVRSDFEQGSIFREDRGWRDFILRSIELAQTKNYVVLCDISDCYQRIPHHRLENALRQVQGAGATPKYIMDILGNFSSGRSYSVPVGGPAARILVEALLNLSDQLLRTYQITFTRYADDYHLFVDSVDQAYECLLFLSEKLLRNEGLALQKSKTRIMTKAEFVSAQGLLLQPDEEDINSDIRHLFSLNLRFDPYSPTAEEDYEHLKDELNQIDILGILNRELAKTRVHGVVTKRVVQAIKHLEGATREGAVLTLAANIDNLYPIFPVVAVTIKSCFSGLSRSAQEDICEKLRSRLMHGSFVVSSELHAAYAIRILAELKSSENVEAIVSMHRRFPGPVVRRDVILAMARWGEFAWLSDQMNDFQAMSSWERRAFIIASYSLRDAGSHWRDRMKKRFDPMELLVRDWMSERASQTGWTVPL